MKFETENDALEYAKLFYTPLYPRKIHVWKEGYKWSLSRHRRFCGCGMCPILRDDGEVK